MLGYVGVGSCVDCVVFVVGWFADLMILLGIAVYCLVLLFC